MSEAKDDDEDLDPVPFILMRAEETFDGQERVLSRAAYDHQIRATGHSASWTGKPSNMPSTGYARAEAKTPRLSPPNGTMKPKPGPTWPHRW